MIDLNLPAARLREAFAAEAACGTGLVVDYGWGPPADRRPREIGPDGGGHGGAGGLVSVGAMAGRSAALSSAALRGSRLTILGSGTGDYPPIERMRDIVADVLNRAAAGQISIEIEEMLLSPVRDAWLRDRPNGASCGVREPAASKRAA